ncbi:MAG: aminotransferase class III-fold pyridoxal phosphate-dependent enzyme [Solirubrobacteraceae bacterium]
MSRFSHIVASPPVPPDEQWHAVRPDHSGGSSLMTQSTYWHPFSAMAEVSGREVVLVRGDRCQLWDDRGREYLDATASLWYCNVGYGRRELVAAATEQMLELAAYSTFDVYANRPALELADRVCAIAPTGPGSAAFFTSGGSDAIDTAAKMVRRYWQVEGRPERTMIVARHGAYHGMNAYGTSLAGIPANASGWGELVGDVVHVPDNDIGALTALLEQHGDRVAAFIGEPVIGAGGVRPPEAGYWAAVQELCRAHDILLVADEVITGFGRLGTWFACEEYGIVPDLLVGAKGITSGYLPLGVVICGDRVRSLLWTPQAGAFRHGYTYSGHAAACAVGLRNLEIIEIERLPERVRRLAPVLARELGVLADHPLVDDVRTAGLLGGVEPRARPPGR